MELAERWMKPNTGKNGPVSLELQIIIPYKQNVLKFVVGAPENEKKFEENEKFCKKL